MDFVSFRSRIDVLRVIFFFTAEKSSSMKFLDVYLNIPSMSDNVVRVRILALNYISLVPICSTVHTLGRTRTPGVF